MRVVETVDVNKEIDKAISDLKNNPDVVQSETARQVAEFTIEVLNEVREKILSNSSDIRTRRYKND